MRKKLGVGLILALLLPFGVAGGQEAPAQEQRKLTDATITCLRSVIISPILITENEESIIIDNPVIGKVFVDDITCEAGRATLSNMVIVPETLVQGQSIGSAMKADLATIWAPTKRDNCERPVNYGVELRNFRWFNWDDTFSNGGNKLFEVIKGKDGKEVRVSTISHFRNTHFIWSPAETGLVSPCSLTGTFRMEGLDTRISYGGSASTIFANEINGGFSFPSAVEDARMMIGNPYLNFDMYDVSADDITGFQILRTAELSVSSSITADSALPWVFLAKKYIRDLVYRTENKDLITVLLPLDLSNTLYFTTGKVTAEADAINIIPAAFIPRASVIDLGSVNMSNASLDVKAVLGMKATDSAQFKMNSRIAGIGDLRSALDLDFQLFSKAILDSVGQGYTDMSGKVAPAMSGAIVQFKDEGFTRIFQSLMKMKASSYIRRTSNDNGIFWDVASNWFRDIEEGKTPSLNVSLPKPELMIDGFFKQMAEKSRVRITYDE